MYLPQTHRIVPELHVQTENASYLIYFEGIDHLPERISKHLPEGHRILLITDHRVHELYHQRVSMLLQSTGRRVTNIVLPAGETSKSSAMLQQIYDEALDSGIDRQTIVIALGGGVVGDLAGFGAATLLRGIPLVHIPTSLVAQVDSSIGGKTGINHATGKNLIGSFYQPSFVLSDVELMSTLSDKEWFGGLAELLKHAIIDSAAHLEAVSTSWNGLLQRNPDAIKTTVPRSASVKVSIVSDDVLEQGNRAFLNFGHTFAHAIERVSGYGVFTHGEAVAVGMTCALLLSSSHFPRFDPKPALELTTSIPRYADLSALSPDDLYDAMLYDKKSRQGERHFVLLEEIGSPKLISCNDRQRITDAWHTACRMLT